MREETQQESPRRKHGARARNRTVASGSRIPTTTTITTGSSTAAGRPRWPLQHCGRQTALATGPCAGARLLARPQCAAHRVLSTRGSMQTASDTGTNRLCAPSPKSLGIQLYHDRPPSRRRRSSKNVFSTFCRHEIQTVCQIWVWVFF